ncbi:hypothetical protein TNCV_896721 [Trichonephila clavipes]|nr:hypothetical protein TNCV_896721 [Trichonephila clavipes]
MLQESLQVQKVRFLRRELPMEIVEKMYEQNAEQQQVPTNRMLLAFVLFGGLTIMTKIKHMSGCNVVALVHPGPMRNVLS